ncbi:ParB/RepB/Spo0J family partition protein [Agrobacterium salinitolerans]|uniref:ParB/RepB/Spo0J family partition protein n=1 Tax=Agrobacterium salinitolerans TaxID=1183413 RepID=UPI0022B8576E|nr:ParB/RepB/Spo0J family partition protein [Agrobacterium salinitolerans]MCZ7855031.1 ParB/RepB/Spo0J family partition protein [Agrobacterium salinitolerans]
MIQAQARTEFVLPPLQHEDIDIESIKIENRYRKDLGDIAVLAASIKEQGLLQPVGVDRDNNLVFGERRIRAFQYLGWSRIPVRRVNVTSIVEGEYAENEVRKDFTASERVAIADVVREAMGNRQGQRTDLSANAAMSGKTVDAAAVKAGFGSAETYERAKSVVSNGAPELVQAMDSGKVSISAAATISKQDVETQKRIVAEDNMAKKAAELRAAEAELARMKSIPKPSPKTAEDRGREKAVFGTAEDRLVWSNINDIIRIIEDQPEPLDAVGRIPPSLSHAIDVKNIRRSAVWLYDFANAWEKKHVA